MSWLKKYLEERWDDKEVQQPARKTKWRLNRGLYPVCRRIKSKRKYRAIIPSEKSAYEIWEEISDFGRLE